MPEPGGLGATGFGAPGARGTVGAPDSTRGAAATGAPGAFASGRVAAGNEAVGTGGAPGGRGATGGAPGGRAAGGAMGDGALGAGAETTGMAEVVFLEGGESGGEGSFTGEVADLGAGGGSGADGSWIGAVELRGAEGDTEEVVDELGVTGAVASRACVTPAPGRARNVMRTVSFLSGTAEVFGVEEGFSDSLMCQEIKNRKGIPPY